MKNFNIFKFNISEIKNESFLSLVPEFRALQGIIENNAWHNHETTFDHTLSVLENLEKIIYDLHGEHKKYLEGIIESHSKNSLLKIAVLFHDIAKKDTLTIDENGRTSFINHEIMSAKKAEKILKRFGISKKEASYILHIIKNHGILHMIFSEEDYMEKAKKIKRGELSNIYLELMLLVYADTKPSYLQISNPGDYKKRIGFYKNELR